MDDKIPANQSAPASAGPTADQHVQAAKQAVNSSLSAQGHTPAASPQASPPPPQADNSTSQAVSSVQDSGTMPMIADDTDLIEKEWVDKAKEVVARTATDPYLQNEELNKVKAEYLKKRYNKDLGQGE